MKWVSVLASGVVVRVKSVVGLFGAMGADYPRKPVEDCRLGGCGRR